VAPKGLGGTREIRADSLTDGLNWEVGLLGKKIEKRRT
jgi:hypothetical protein